MDGLKRNWSVSAQQKIEFSVVYSAGIFSNSNKDLLELGETPRRLVVFDKTVYNLYGDLAKTYFEHHKIDTTFVIIDATEENKDFQNTEIILQAMEDFGVLRRSEPIIAVGGGVLLDIVGFASSIFRRGVPYLRVPTTLLAIVDASVGAKTGVNHFQRRNRLGTYYPPVISYLDKTFIKSQDNREISNGLAEILKIAIIKDAELFNLLETNADKLIDEKFQLGAVPVRVINRAITGMVEELAPNLWEKDLERCVDFGHSFSPLIEMKSLPVLSHGEAVCIDCLFSSFISVQRGLMGEDELERVISTIEKLKLPTFHELFGESEMVSDALVDTVKHRNGNQNLPIPIGIGDHSFINDLKLDEIKQVSAIMKKRFG